VLQVSVSPILTSSNPILLLVGGVTRCRFEEEYNLQRLDTASAATATSSMSGLRMRPDGEVWPSSESTCASLTCLDFST